MWQRKEKAVQLEIFTKDIPSTKAQKTNKGLPLHHIRGHEKIILVSMALIVSWIICFSLGVEHGRQMNRVSSAGTENVIKLTERPSVIEKKPKEKEIVYTIQIVTFSTESAAEKEIKRLKEKGLKPLIFSKGKYIQICIGSFLNKEEALSSLKDLRKRYSDCFIRRL